MRNIELKARCADLALAAERVTAFGATFAGVLEQTDTYFVVPHGRLKLRQTSGKPAELIGYTREDSVVFRPSDYRRVEIARPVELKAVLGGTLGVRCTVRKSRRLYLWQNVRIHLDRVEGLGGFIEFEAMIRTPEDEAAAQAQLAHLSRALAIRDEDRIAESYSDLAGRR